MYHCCTNIHILDFTSLCRWLGPQSPRTAIHWSMGASQADRLLLDQLVNIQQCLSLPLSLPLLVFHFSLYVESIMYIFFLLEVAMWYKHFTAATKMTELGFEVPRSTRSAFTARDASPDSVIFTLDSNFSVFSSNSASVDRCSFASDAQDHDSEVSPVLYQLYRLLHLANRLPDHEICTWAQSVKAHCGVNVDFFRELSALWLM